MNAASENAASELDAASAIDTPDGRPERLLAEAREAVASSANALRSVRERFREGHLEQVARWDGLRDELASADRRTSEPRALDAGDAQPGALRRDEAIAASAVGTERSGLERLDLAIQSLESAWLFLGQDDATLVADPSAARSVTDVQMRIVEAQEAERTRLAREVHDGPAQALSNAVFQVEIVERMLGRDPFLAAAELRTLREMLHRELAGVRAFISQLRPPILEDLGLEEAIREAAQQVAQVLGIPITVEVEPGIAELGGASETVALRVVQEALQNIRRHAEARRVAIRGALEHGEWVVEIHDDGKGFDVGAVAARGRRNFGLQFMRERTELIGARFEVRSHPDGGTVVRIAIPRGAEESR